MTTYPQPAIEYGTDSMSSFGQRALDTVQEWTPRVVAALLILLVGYLIARAVKWAIASLVNKSPLGKRANDPAHPERHPQTVGAQVGNAAFWLILLVAIVIAAQPLGLTTATGPLNTMLNDFGNVIPNIIGAGLIFFIGWIVASVAKKAIEAVLTAARTEQLSSRVGIKTTDATTLPKIVGGIVFALIIIPVSIAALEQLNIRSISEPATAMLRLVLNAIPRVITAGIVLAIAYTIARFASQLLTRFLQGAGFDSAIGSLGLFPNTPVRVSPISASPSGSTTFVSAGAAAEAASEARVDYRTPSGLVGSIVMVAIILFGLMEAFRLLNFAYGSAMMSEILSLLGSVIFGAVIIAAAVAIAGFVSRLVTASSGGQLAASMIRVAIIVLGTAIGLRFMGLADDIINLAFGLILGSAALAAAIAFGLGGRNAAARISERMADRVEATSVTDQTRC